MARPARHPPAPLLHGRDFRRVFSPSQCPAADFSPFLQARQSPPCSTPPGVRRAQNPAGQRQSASVNSPTPVPTAICGRRIGRGVSQLRQATAAVCPRELSSAFRNAFRNAFRSPNASVGGVREKFFFASATYQIEAAIEAAASLVGRLDVVVWVH